MFYVKKTLILTNLCVTFPTRVCELNGESGLSITQIEQAPERGCGGGSAKQTTFF